MLLRKNICQRWVFNRGDLNFLRPQCPITRIHLRQSEMESCNILNCSNNKIIYGNGLFVVVINELLETRSSQFGIPYSAFIRTSTTDTNSNISLADNLNCVLWCQGTQILPCGNPPPPPPRGWGVGWYRLAHGLLRVQIYLPPLDLLVSPGTLTTLRLSSTRLELLHVYTLSRTLRSSSDTHMLEIQQYKRKTHGFRTFSCFGPRVWNSLPQDLRHCRSTLSSFKAKLNLNLPLLTVFPS